ncbi:turripeptide OL11-like isoform X1 [Trichogramma pretiosum]|uniref:turripeptide OL11-like isoform X1 n=1 Tax=Trichogramma pretiosum TaxID=7493 RepID=UPI0006C9533B|nr:turripeptide OL11-like isoform X1 [Trichogramma pretiosum]
MTKLFVVLCVLMSSFLIIQGTTIRFREKGEADNNCDCITTYEFLPVCGSNGKSYPNEGTLKCANECEGGNIQVRHKGLCQE